MNFGWASAGTAWAHEFVRCDDGGRQMSDKPEKRQLPVKVKGQDESEVVFKVGRVEGGEGGGGAEDEELT